MKKIGIYGGSFDPIHFGHINLALEMKEKHGLDEIWMCPAKINPHKKAALPTEVSHRLKMLELALEDLPDFSILDIEINRDGPSYTVDTLHQLMENPANRQNQFFLILGDDAAKGFFSWHKPDEIVRLVPLLIGTRIHEDEKVLNDDLLIENPIIYEAIKKGLTLTKIMEISGTCIRDRLQKGLYIEHLVPAKVVDYIYMNGIYLGT